MQNKGKNICFGDLTYEDIKQLKRRDKKELLYFLYLLKSKIGYYNFIGPEDLRYQYELKCYGIPADYKYAYVVLESVAITDKIDMIIGEIVPSDFMKVLILPQ